MSEFDKKHFDEKAKVWDANPIHLERSKHIAEAIKNQIPLNKNIKAFEYGSGTGLLSFELQPYLGSIVMADSSDGMLEILHEKVASADFDNLSVLKLDLMKDHFSDDTYNLIYSQMTLHHIPDIPHILKVFNDMLDEGGYLCIADLDKEDGSFHGPDVTDVHRGFDRDELTQQAKEAGFSDISFITAFTMNREIDGEKKTFPIFLMTAKKN